MMTETAQRHGEIGKNSERKRSSGVSEMREQKPGSSAKNATRAVDYRLRAQEERRLAESIVYARLREGDQTRDQLREEFMSKLESLAQQRDSIDRSKDGMRLHTERQIKVLKDQLDVLAGLQAEENIVEKLAELSDAGSILDSLILETEKTLEREKAIAGATTGARRDQIMPVSKLVAELMHSGTMLVSEKELGLLKTIRQYPSKLQAVRSRVQELRRIEHTGRLKKTGGIGGSHEHWYLQYEPRPSQEEPTTINKQWLAAGKELADTVREYQGLTWMERAFGEKGRFLRQRIERLRVRAEQQKSKLASERIGEAFDAVRTKYQKRPSHDVSAQQPRISLPNTTWEKFQAWQRHWEDLQQQRGRLSKWPWADQAEKKRLDALIEQARIETVRAKDEHGQHVRQQSLKRDAERTRHD